MRSTIIMNTLLNRSLLRAQGTTGSRRRRYSLADKIAIVRESLQPGVTQAYVSRRHNLGKNVLWTWRKSLAIFVCESQNDQKPVAAQDVSALQERVAELERMLGKKSFEIELLRNRIEGSARGALYGQAASSAVDAGAE